MAPTAKTETCFLVFEFGGALTISLKKTHIVGPHNLRQEMMGQNVEKKENVSLASWAELNHHVWTCQWALERIPGDIEVSLCLLPTSSQPIRQSEHIDGHKMMAVRNGQWRTATVFQVPPADSPVCIRETGRVGAPGRLTGQHRGPEKGVEEGSKALSFAFRPANHL